MTVEEGIQKCLETKDFIASKCTFVQKCKEGFVRNDKGNCVRSTPLAERINSARKRLNDMRQRNNFSGRGKLIMDLRQIQKMVGIPNRNQINGLIESAKKLSEREMKALEEKQKRKNASAMKKLEKIEQQKRNTQKKLQKAVESAKKKAEKALTKGKTKKSVGFNIGNRIGTSLNASVSELSKIGKSAIKNSSRSGSQAVPVITAAKPVLTLVESAAKALSQIPKRVMSANRVLPKRSGTRKTRSI